MKKLNILLISPYRQSDGWGQASKDYIRAFAKTGHNIHIRPIYLGHSFDTKIDEDLELLEKEKYERYDAVVQLMLPPFLSYNANFGINIGFSFFETQNIQYSGWVKHINLMDMYFVASEKEKESLIKSGVTIPVKVIGPTVDIEKFLSIKDKFQGLEHKSFKFYFIGEHSIRKNLNALLIAFHREFTKADDVDLVIKANIPGATDEQLYQKLTGDILNIKQSLKLYPKIENYNQEICIIGKLSEEQLQQLHQSCDCFVMPSYGEAICRPALDAMGFGNPAIVTDNTGMNQFVNKKNGWLIDSKESPVFHPPVVAEDIYTTYETWQQPDILSLQRCMRQAYESQGRKGVNRKKSAASDIYYKYNYAETASRINEVLCQS